MKMIKLAAMVAALATAQMAMADSIGFNTNQQSDRHILTGTVNNKGQAGASFMVVDKNATGRTANNQFVFFSKIAEKAGRFFTSKNVVHRDNNGVYVVRMYNMSGGIYKIIPMPDHSGLGRMSFAQVGNQDVWFGDWADVKAGSANGSAGTNYSVYYAGAQPTTNLPTSGQATYDVKGINNHVAHNTEVLQGTLTADFGKSTLVGQLQRSDLAVGIDARIQADASFKGGATANGVKGNTQGQFFGNQGEALAGVATFGTNSQLNTAFGGTKR